VEVFFASPWIPAEWIKAHGLTPRGVWPADSEHPLPVTAGVCAFAQSFLSFAENHPDAAIIFTTTCDQMRRAFDTATPQPEWRFLFNVPATWQSPVARKMYRAEVERLGRFLVRLGGCAPTPARLAEIILEHDQARKRLRDAAPKLSARVCAETIARFHWDGTVHLPPKLPASGAPAAAIAIVGAPLCASQWQLLEAIESAGGRVVLNGTESGERSLLPQLPLADWSRDPVGALADGYFDHSADAFQRPHTRLYDWLGRGLRERAARGLVLWSWLACDLWRAEAASLREAFGLPVLLLEADEARGVSPRELGRLQAFLEMLR
jgi:hypothetical protein